MKKSKKLMVTLGLWSSALDIDSDYLLRYLEQEGLDPDRLYKDTERCGWRWSVRLARWLPYCPYWVYGLKGKK